MNTHILYILTFFFFFPPFLFEENCASKYNLFWFVNGGRNDIVRIDIERLVSSIKDAPMSSKCCIFKIPIILRRINEEAYVPDAFSIGPFHHGDRKLRDTQSIKIKYFKDLISRSHFPEQILRNLIDYVMEVDKEACECYAWPIDNEPNDFVKILVIDGCFIIELLRKEAYPNLKEEDDPIFTKFCMKKFLFHDFILLENQVPWMVLTPPSLVRTCHKNF